MDSDFFESFLSNIGIKQVSFSPILFGLCIDKLETTNKVVQDAGLDGPKLVHELIFILLYADDVVLFSYNLNDMQNLLDALDTFYQITGLTVNVDNKKDVNKGNTASTLLQFT